MKKFYTITVILLLTIAGKAQVTWTTLEIEEGFNDISCVNENITYICGNAGRIMKTEDGGKTWELIHEERLLRLHAIKFLDEQTGFVSGGAIHNTGVPVEKGGILWRTTDGGVSWQDITPPDSINTLENIFPIDEDTLYIIHSGILLKTTDAGISWDTACPLFLTESMTNFHIIDSVGYATAFGFYTGGTKIYQTLDYAQTWQEVYRNSSLILTESNNDLVFFHKDTVYVYLPDSLLYTTDGFATYERCDYFLGYQSPIKVKRFLNGNYCIATNNRTGYCFYGQANGNGFYKGGFYNLMAVDGCNDSIFYVLSLSGDVYTNRYFEPDDTNNLITIENEGFAVFPNPTTGQLTIENGEWRIENIEIYDVFGRNVGANLCVFPETTIDISHLSAGIYFLQIKTEKGTITKKITKQ